MNRVKLLDWLSHDEPSKRAAAASILIDEGTSESFAAVRARILVETDEWVFVLLLECLRNRITIGEIHQVSDQILQAETPTLQYVFLGWIKWNSIDLTPSSLIEYFERGPWFVKLIAASLMESVTPEILNTMHEIADQAARKSLPIVEVDVCTSPFDQLLYDQEQASQFAKQVAEAAKVR